MDSMLAIALFYLMVSPCGARLSVDRLVQRFRRVRFAQAHPGDRPSRWMSSRASRRTWPCTAVPDPLLHHLHQLRHEQAAGGGVVERDGDLADAGQLRVHSRPRIQELYTKFLTFLASSLPLWHLTLIAGSAFTIALEIGLPFLIWYPRWRPFCPHRVGPAAHRHRPDDGHDLVQPLMIIMVGSFLPAASVRRLIDKLTRAAGPAPVARRGPRGARSPRRRAARWPSRLASGR